MNGLCNKECSRCALYKDHCGGCSLCEAAFCNKNCRSCYALCSHRAEAIPYLNLLGGPDIELKGNKEMMLPEHIPVLPDMFQKMPKYELMPVIGIHAGNMFSRNGEKINPSYLDRGFAKALNIDPRSEGVLQFYVKDRTLEGFWDHRDTIYRDLKKMRLKAIISPNFSVYEDAPRMDHIYNIKRTTIVYNELIEHGFNAIPDVSWYNKNDLDKWIREINKNNVRTIAFSFQVVDVKLKASNLWRNYVLGFRYLCQNVAHKLNIVIIGVTTNRRLESIFKAADGHRLSILNQSAYVQSRRGMFSEKRQPTTEYTKDYIFEKNILYFNEEYKQMNKKYNTMG